MEKILPIHYAQKYLGMENSRAIRGICAFLVIMHHIATQISGGKLFNFIFLNIGSSVVTLFFFYSGYGLMYNLHHKKDYLKGFFTNRIGVILLPYLFVNILYLPFFLALGMDCSPHKIIGDFIAGYPFVPYSWYVVSLLIFYLAFYLIFRYFSVKAGVILEVCFFALYIITMIVIGYPEWWYNTCATFLAGIFFAIYYEQATRLIQKHYILTFLGLAFAFLVLLVLSKKVNQVLLLAMIKSLRSVVFSLLCITASMLVTFKDKLTSYLGNLSLELYLMQGLAFLLVAKVISVHNKIAFSVASIVLAIILAHIVHRINQILIYSLKKQVL